MKEIIKKSLNKAMTYEEYKEHIKKLIVAHKNKQIIDEDPLINYTILNEKRMKRLEKQIQIEEIIHQEVGKVNNDFTWLVLTESWCGDAAQSLPIIKKMVEPNPRINLKIVNRDENDALMTRFLTNGSKSIPKLIVIDNQTEEVIGDWGPRSKEATKLVQDYKLKFGQIDAKIKEDLQVWYNQDKGLSIQNDLLEMLKKMQENAGSF